MSDLVKYPKDRFSCDCGSYSLYTEDKEVVDARTFWWETRDSKAALDKFPKHCHIERTILEGLIANGNTDYLGALRKVFLM